MPFDNTTTLVVEVFKMAERSDSCSGDTLLNFWTKKEEAAEKDDYRLQTTTGEVRMFSKSLNNVLTFSTVFV